MLNAEDSRYQFTNSFYLNMAHKTFYNIDTLDPNKSRDVYGKIELFSEIIEQKMRFVVMRK